MKKLLLRLLGVLLMTIGLIVWIYLGYNMFQQELNEAQVLKTYPWESLGMMVSWVVGLYLSEEYK